MYDETSPTTRHGKMFALLRSGMQANMTARRKAVQIEDEAGLHAFQAKALQSFKQPEA